MSLGFWLILTFYIGSILALRWTSFWRKSFLEPVALWLIISGIVFISQPWWDFLFRNGLTVLILGLIYWNIAGNMKPGKWEQIKGEEV